MAVYSQVEVAGNIGGLDDVHDSIKLGRLVLSTVKGMQSRRCGVSIPYHVCDVYSTCYVLRSFTPWNDTGDLHIPAVRQQYQVSALSASVNREARGRK